MALRLYVLGPYFKRSDVLFLHTPTLLLLDAQEWLQYTLRVLLLLIRLFVAQISLSHVPQLTIRPVFLYSE